MLRRVLGASILLSLLALLVYTVLLNPAAEASPQELTVITKTTGHEELKATIVDGEVRFRLKNNYRETITAFAIKFGDLMIKEDFAFSEVHFGIEPGDIFETSYAVSRAPTGELPTLYLLTVLLKNGAHDGNPKVAQGIRDVRLGNKIQLLRTLRILEKEGQSGKDLKTIKSDIVAALNAGEFETRIILKELQPSSPTDSKLSDDLRNGLHWGREKMLRRFEELEQVPSEYREEELVKVKERAHKVLAKL
jgi:hypothetical protein